MDYGLQSLASRRSYNDMTFVHKLINGKLSCPEFLRQINFKISAFDYQGIFLVFDKYLSNVVRNTAF